MTISWPVSIDLPNGRPDLPNLIGIDDWVYSIVGAALHKRALRGLAVKLAVSYETFMLKPRLPFVAHEKLPSQSARLEDGDGTWLSRSTLARTTKDNAL
ncbi:hypothetical protein [Tabrizicola sp.]|uniref:hypothetical protein n=1 Tax=Tabrizicola sp. TaxID=2005166 RepID=UPI003D2CA41E